MLYYSMDTWNDDAAVLGSHSCHTVWYRYLHSVTTIVILDTVGRDSVRHYVRPFVGCLTQILTAAATAAAANHQLQDEEVVSRRIFDPSPAAACYLFASNHHRS